MDRLIDKTGQEESERLKWNHLEIESWIINRPETRKQSEEFAAKTVDRDREGKRDK